MRFTSLNKLLIFVLLAGCAAFGQSINLDTQVKGSRLPMWAVDSGSANAYAIATIGALGPSLRTGSRFAFIATHANTTASTLVVDGGSTIAIKKNVSAALVSGDIALNQVIEVTYDGTNFQLVGPGALTFSAISGTLGCSQLPTFTGDVTNSSCAMTLASVVTAGSCGDSTHSCGLTYDAKGRITAASNNVISGGGGGASSFVLIQTITASNSAELDFTSCISGTYDNYWVIIDSLVPVTNSVAINLQFSTNGGSTWDTTAANYIWDYGFSQEDGTGSGVAHNGTFYTAPGFGLWIGADINNDAHYGTTGFFQFFDMNSTTAYKKKRSEMVVKNGSANIYGIQGGGTYLSTTAVNAFRILASSGNLASGKVRCYGLQ